MIYIIIPVHNRKEFTRNCLFSLRAQNYKEYKAIVIDDGSIDGTSDMLKNEFPEVHIIYGNGKLWWTASTNLGVKYALEKLADYIMTLNNDTIATEDFLAKMVYWSEKYPNALLGALATDSKTKLPIYGGEIINWKLANYKNLLEVIPEEKQYGLHEVTHFPGRGLLIPSEAFKKIGLYDEKHFPQYAADYDFTHRAIRSGFKVYCNYDAKLSIYPEESGNLKNRKRKNLKNYFNHLFGIKGGANLMVFIKYAIRNCPKIYLLLYIPLGLLRRILGYLYK